MQANENILNIDQSPFVLGIDLVYGHGFVNPSNNPDPGMLNGDNEDSELSFMIKMLMNMIYKIWFQNLRR